MAQAQKGLGRGLEALLGGFRDDAGADQGVRTVALDAIRPNPEQPRRVFSAQALEDLAASIREQGLISPVLVRPVTDGPADYEIVAGERRWRAARLAGLREIPVVVREVDDEQSLALALIENLQREDLNPMEQASGLHLLQTRFGLSQDQMARKVGLSRPAVANTLRLLQLPESVRADLAAGVLTPGHGRALLSLADETLRQALWRRIVEVGLSVRQAEEAAAFAKVNGCLPETASQAGSAREPRKRPPGAVPDLVLRSIEDRLTSRIGVLVKSGGTLDHGKLTFHYSSQRELAALLAQFGLDLAESGEGAGS